MKRILFLLLLTYPLISLCQSSVYDENYFKNYFDNSEQLDLIEGIWIGKGPKLENFLKSAIIAEGDHYRQYRLEIYDSELRRYLRNRGLPQQHKAAKIERTAVENFFIYENDLVNIIQDFQLISNNTALLSAPEYDPLRWIKTYPILSERKTVKKPDGWAGNGSGIIISKSGFIVTNNHVIEDADEVEVEFILDGEIKKFNAEIVQVDKINDLAIIKIFDMDFNGVDDLPYNFKSRTSDVGTKVYAYGYPMALSVMGKEIKITDGIISSKSGYDGDITTYQISAPIQGGNSGGPLFDDKGNFIGINSSGLRSDVADNVGYTIKSNYVLNLIDVLPKSIDLPSSTKLQSLSLTEQIKEISKYVVLIKVK